MALSAQLSQPRVAKLAASNRPIAFTAARVPKAARSINVVRTQRELSVTCQASITLLPEQKSAVLPNKDYHPSPLSQPAPETYAVIEVGGQQLFVEPGKWYSVNRLAAEEGSTLKFGRVLMYKNSGEVQFGTPYLDNVTVQGEIMDHYKGEKILIYKMKIKKHYRRKNGHRQPLTKFQITKIEAGPAAPAPTVSGEQLEKALQRVKEEQRDAVKAVLTGDDALAAVRTALKLY